jgi:crotonobetainyl-CoA:carnitine CoA-transferase CaiB-like acyl-CoA transferase
MSGPGVETQRAPLLGEYNDYVFRQILGLTEEEISRLQRDGVLK